MIIRIQQLMVKPGFRLDRLACDRLNHIAALHVVIPAIDAFDDNAHPCRSALHTYFKIQTGHQAAQNQTRQAEYPCYP